jgi:hypothetical protein
MRKLRNLSKIVFFTVILLTTHTLNSAQPQYAQRKQSAQERRDQLKQDASTATSEVDTKCKEILGYVNSGKTLSKQELREALHDIAKNRKYLPVIDNPQKSTYHILSAWVYYFDNKQDKALKEAASGQKADPQNLNAVKTHLALSVIYRDYASATEALTEQSTGTEETNSQSPQQINEGDIQLEVNSVRIGLLGKVFDFHPEPVGPNSTSWKSAGRVTCALLWKIDANELNSFAPVEKAKPAETNEPNASQHEPNLPTPTAPEPSAESNAVTTAPENTASQSQESSPAAEEIPASSTQAVPEQPYQAQKMPELEAFSQLQNQFVKDKRAVFVGINLNDPAKRKNLENWFSKNPQTWQIFLLPAEQRQKMFACLDGGLDKPMLLIVAPDSTIRYAGRVESFLPKMIIRGILENSKEFAEPNEPNRPPAAAESNLPAVKSVQPAQLPVEPKITPVLNTDANANKTTVNTQQPQTTTASAPVKQQLNEDFSADDYQAETLLSNARTFLQISNRLPSHMYRKPVEMCRRVMKDYPNTKYAQEAQILLRNVPKEYRQQYNLTDEELGL